MVRQGLKRRYSTELQWKHQINLIPKLDLYGNIHAESDY